MVVTPALGKGLLIPAMGPAHLSLLFCCHGPALARWRSSARFYMLGQELTDASCFSPTTSHADLHPAISGASSAGASWLGADVAGRAAHGNPRNVAHWWESRLLPGFGLAFLACKHALCLSHTWVKGTHTHFALGDGNPPYTTALGSSSGEHGAHPVLLFRKITRSILILL